MTNAALAGIQTQIALTGQEECHDPTYVSELSVIYDIAGSDS
jgi:hypothetical protein